MLNAHRSVAQIVIEHASCAPVFHRHRIDFCCRGELSLASACEQVGIAPSSLLGELEEAIAATDGESGLDPRAISTPALLGHIAEYHEEVRCLLPSLRITAMELARAHGAYTPALVDLDSLLQLLEATLSPILDWEERELFPAVLADGSADDPLSQLFSAMKREHVAAYECMRRIHGCLDILGTPSWANDRFFALRRDLEALERDLATHFHLENYVIRPRVLHA